MSMTDPPPDAFAVPNALLSFSPQEFGVDVLSGLVDGKHVGIMTATVCALARHQVRVHRPSEYLAGSLIQQTHTGHTTTIQ